MKPSIPKGTRDFVSQDIYKRKYIFSIIQKHFQTFGYQPLETPTFENLGTLTGKYGEEGDRLIFKILNSSINEAKDDKKIAMLEDFKTSLERPFNTENLTDKALRYDLTVPFARFVAMNHGQLVFPFKRYQMQPVWRADRPQKGRYREFYQCDADVVGSHSLWIEVESILLYDTIFSELGINVTIHLNNRKILAGIAEYANISEQLIDFTIALDKLDKIGKEKVIEEMLSKNISLQAVEKLNPLFENYKDNVAKISVLKDLLKGSEVGEMGLQEIEFILKNASEIGLKKADLQFDITLARGLDYYTGAIVEVKAKNVDLGSIGGGGRYDNLTEIFGVKDISGMGISFGLDRIFLVLEALQLFPKKIDCSTDILFVHFSEEESLQTQSLLVKLREHNIKCELYPEATKLKKQFTYAEKRNISFLAFYGKKEQEKEVVLLKNIVSGEQEELIFDNLINKFS